MYICVYYYSLESCYFYNFNCVDICVVVEIYVVVKYFGFYVFWLFEELCIYYCGLICCRDFYDFFEKWSEGRFKIRVLGGGCN